MKFDEVEFFLTLAQCNMSNTVVTWPPSILKSGPIRFFDPLHIVFGLKLPNLRLPKVLDCLRKFPVYTWSKQFPGDALWKRCSENFSRFTDKHKKQSSGGVMLNFVNISGKFCKFTEKHLCCCLLKLQAGSLKLSEAATGDVLQKMMFLEIL